MTELSRMRSNVIKYLWVGNKNLLVQWAPSSLAAAVAAAKLLQPCPTLWDPIDGSPPGSPLPGILQARTLEWVAISFSNAWKWKVKVKSLSRVQLFMTPWTAAYQAPLSMWYFRQEYWSGLPLPSPPELMTQGYILPKTRRNKNVSWLWLRSWTPYGQTQTSIEESRENQLDHSSMT